jgi:rhodanese-related sulfurtransferase
MITGIGPQELKSKMNEDQDFLLIDIREPYEYEEFNLGGKLIPMGDLLDRIDELEDFREREIVVHCRSGKRSSAACEVLNNMGFEKIINLNGGVVAWINVYGHSI